MYRRFTYELLSFYPEFERILFKLRMVKADNIIMEEQNSDRYSESHSDHNEILRMLEPDESKTHPFLSSFFMHIESLRSNLMINYEFSPRFMFCRKLKKRSKIQ